MQKFTVQSTDHVHALNVVLWQPTQAPIAVIQILTGMAEYIERYAALAQFLNDHRIAVIGHDHVGQGHSVQSADELGYFGQHGLQTLTNDCRLIGQLTHEKYPEIPLFVLGHSMGSMLATQYVKQTEVPIAGTVLIGVIDVPFILKPVLPIVKLIGMVAAKRPGTLWNKLAFGLYSKRFDTQRPFSWLSYNQANVAHYEQHPLCGYVFSNNGFAMLFSLTALTTHADWQFALQSRPILVMSGADDPAGGYGHRAKRLIKQFKKHTVKKATVCILPKTAHELLLETNAKQHYQFIYTWLLKAISESPLRHHSSH
ncbi:alpha/beta fold hydrolase [Latilactobacillus graminis]|uniref:Aminopeptidase n=2 Tax=Latilactobacillus graminis TaxID=60519 RepID=A0AA89I0J7_9LACO|nr:alpha/beta hydrolase [Latilactobacillus graminis]KRM21093.1 aminopeptidase [Latilactobacillus graminis DSM 20719]QFP79221.1 alpha/beta hydrolase [Latilactobacillus graminis]